MARRSTRHRRTARCGSTGLHFAKELFWSLDGYRIVQAVGEDLIWNMVVNPRALVEIGTVARRADLSGELAELQRRELPILVLWGGGDGVLPLSSFDALCAAIGTEGKVLRGGHSWLLANPRALSEVLDNVVHVQVAERGTAGIGTTSAELRQPAPAHEDPEAGRQSAAGRGITVVVDE